MVDSLSPAAMLPLLLPYADVHKNPKVRGKAGAALAAAVARMPPADVAAAGLPRLLQLAGKLVTGARTAGPVGTNSVPCWVGRAQRARDAWAAAAASERCF